ncbi:MAG: carboxypeptidase-like regulatory domain-containing protein [Bacteroidota bacterium]
MKTKLPLFKHIHFMMTLSIFPFLVLLMCTSVSIAHDTQAQEILNRSISIHVQNSKLSAVLNQIEEQADVKFVYSTKINASQKVSVNSQKNKLSEILDEILSRNSIQYEVVENHILLKKQVIESKPAASNALPAEIRIQKADKPVKGKVKDENGQALLGVNVWIKGTNKGTTTANDGSFSLTLDNEKSVLVFSFVGYKSFEIEASKDLNIQLAPDNLQLEQVVVTSSGAQHKKFESSVAISTINAKQIAQRPPLNSMDLLKVIPGLSAESSGGDGPGSVRVRGLPGGGLTLMGIMEDGLPVLPTGFSTSPSADQYYKVDLSIKTVEAIRGGHAAIILANTPGAMLNIISNTGGEKFGGKIKYTRGLSQNADRYDFNIGGKIADKWYYNVAGFLRLDDGIRPPSFRANEGGQVKANVSYNYKENSYFRFYGKYLNDKTTWLVPAYYGWDGSGLGTAAKGFDLFTEILTPRDTKFTLNAPNSKSYNIDLADGVKMNSQYLGADWNHETNNHWTIRNNVRYQVTDSKFNGALITAPTAYSSSKKYYYLDGQEIVSPTGYYTGQSVITTINTDRQFIDKLDISKKINNHFVSFGAGIHTYDVDAISLGAAFNSEIKNQPRVILVGSPTLAAATGTSISGYTDGSTVTNSVWASDEVILGKWILDASVRFDQFINAGKRLINATPWTNTKDYEETQNLNTISLGFNHSINEKNAIYGRYTKTYSAMTIGQYAAFTFNPATVKDKTINMAEIGYKINMPKFSLFSSLVYADLNNIASSMLIPNTVGSFISVPTFASSRNYSAEIEATYSPSSNLNFKLTATLQNSKYTSYSVVAPSTARADLANKPFVWDGNYAERIPSYMIDFAANYKFGKFDAFSNIRFIGKTWSAPSNVYQLGAYNEWTTGLEYAVSKAIGIRVWGNNLLNSRGMTEGNVRGDQFLLNGAFAEGSLQIGRIILPRNFWASLTYSF